MAKDYNKSYSGWNTMWTPNTYGYGEGWFAGTKGSGQQDLTKWLRNYLKTQGYNSDFINKISDRELLSYADEYFYEGEKLLGNTNYYLEGDSVLKDLQTLKWIEPPDSPDYKQIYQDATAVIDAENAELYKMYDEILGKQTQNYNQQIQDINTSYNDYRNQMLSNDYIKNAQIMNTVNSSLSKSRQNALQAGASAGLRLANNVNTLLSTQNQQASQSLQTSNNLAQMLLNQRQAAAGIRNDYTNALTQNTANKANVKAGSAERIENYANTRFNTEQNIYQNQLDNWETVYNSKYGNNAFADAFKNYNISKNASKYGY